MVLINLAIAEDPFAIVASNATSSLRENVESSNVEENLDKEMVRSYKVMY